MATKAKQNIEFWRGIKADSTDGKRFAAMTVEVDGILVAIFDMDRLARQARTFDNRKAAANNIARAEVKSARRLSRFSAGIADKIAERLAAEIEYDITPYTPWN